MLRFIPLTDFWFVHRDLLLYFRFKDTLYRPQSSQSEKKKKKKTLPNELCVGFQTDVSVPTDGGFVIIIQRACLLEFSLHAVNSFKTG